MLRNWRGGSGISKMLRICSPGLRGEVEGAGLVPSGREEAKQPPASA